MTDVRKAVARINPHGANYSGSGGSGGTPDIVDSDINGALGFIANDFDREVFCALWCPEMAKLTRLQFDMMLRDKQALEFIRRQRILVSARLAVDLAKEEADGTHRDIPGVRRSLSHARAALDDASSKAWPPWQRASTKKDPAQKSKYSLIRTAVLREIAEPRTCKVCHGHCHTFKGALAVPCMACHGTGQHPKSNRWRAEAIKVPHQKFNKWAGVYLWTFLFCKRAENRAIKIMKKNLEMAPC